MTKKIFLALTALVALTLSFSSCKKDNQGGKNPKSEVKLRVEPKEVKVMVGKTAELTVTVEPADTKYTFESANADIATVSDKGVITGVKVGKTVISVKAGDVTKTADVEVLDAGNVDKSRYIGTPDEKGYIAPIYVVEAPKIQDLKDIITEANKVNGYTFDEDYEMNNGGHVLIYMGPNDGKQWTDDRLIGEIGYYYFPEPESNFMMVFMKSLLDEDLVQKAVDGDEEAQQALFGVTAAYGFDKELGGGTLGDGAPCLVAYNMDQFPEGPYEMMVLSNKSSETGKYSIRFQIVQRAPQAQSSLAQRTPMMPELQFPSSLKKML